ncbi:MAG: SRPBCC domain-containing protein [Acidobacteriota bacterium]|nr:SRPBCC domain-containing protein [Acidobacteriota bacterium]
MNVFRFVAASDPVEIEAPAERVWDILVDFDRYGEWNPFTTRVEASLEIGAPVMLHVRLGWLKRKQPERIETVEPPHLLAWGVTMGARFLLVARREQRLEPLGANRCRYVTTDETHGLLTPLVALLFGRLIRQGFNDLAAALKTRAEG